MIDPAAIAPIYDFSLIEKAIQSYFCSDEDWPFVKPPSENDGDAWKNRETWMPGGKIPFFTAYETLIFQKHRPRVGIDLNNISPLQMPVRGHVDADGNLRNEWWRANLIIACVTVPNYTLHVQLRGIVMAIAAAMAAPTQDAQPTGANQYLAFHEITDCWDTNNNTIIHPEDGNYLSRINYNLTFAVKPSAWDDLG